MDKLMERRQIQIYRRKADRISKQYQFNNIMDRGIITISETGVTYYADSTRMMKTQFEIADLFGCSHANYPQGDSYAFTR